MAFSTPVTQLWQQRCTSEILVVLSAAPAEKDKARAAIHMAIDIFIRLMRHWTTPGAAGLQGEKKH
jgi:hypothetical protein